MRALGASEHGIAAWTTAIRIAETLGDVDRQLRDIWALWVDALNRAEPHLGMDYVRRFLDLATQSDDPADLIGQRLEVTLHGAGAGLLIVGDSQETPLLAAHALLEIVMERRRERPSSSA